MASTMDFRDSTFDDFNRPKLDVCTNLQNKDCIGEQIALVAMELLNNAHHIREMDLEDLPQIWKESRILIGNTTKCYEKCALSYSFISPTGQSKRIVVWAIE